MSSMAWMFFPGSAHGLALVAWFGLLVTCVAIFGQIWRSRALVSSRRSNVVPDRAIISVDAEPSSCKASPSPRSSPGELHRKSPCGSGSRDFSAEVACAFFFRAAAQELSVTLARCEAGSFKLISRRPTAAAAVQELARADQDSLSTFAAGSRPSRSLRHLWCPFPIGHHAPQRTSSSSFPCRLAHFTNFIAAEDVESKVLGEPPFAAGRRVPRVWYRACCRRYCVPSTYSPTSSLPDLADLRAGAFKLFHAAVIIKSSRAAAPSELTAPVAA